MADEACLRLLEDAKVVAKRLDAIREPVECGLSEPVRLEAVMLDDGTRVALEPAPVMRCALAEAVAAHVRHDLAGVAAGAGSRLLKVETAAGYECRGRNRVAGAKISEHGHGNALDIHALVLADKRVLTVAPQAMSITAAEAWRAGACARFTTVLGPGSDGYHESHVHVDLAERRGGHRLCQWTLPLAAETAHDEAKPSR